MVFVDYFGIYQFLKEICLCDNRNWLNWRPVRCIYNSHIIFWHLVNVDIIRIIELQSNPLTCSPHFTGVKITGVYACFCLYNQLPPHPMHENIAIRWLLHTNLCGNHNRPDLRNKSENQNSTKKRMPTFGPFCMPIQIFLARPWEHAT